MFRPTAFIFDTDWPKLLLLTVTVPYLYHSHYPCLLPCMAGREWSILPWTPMPSVKRRLRRYCCYYWFCCLILARQQVLFIIYIAVFPTSMSSTRHTPHESYCWLSFKMGAAKGMVLLSGQQREINLLSILYFVNKNICDKANLSFGCCLYPILVYTIRIQERPLGQRKTLPPQQTTQCDIQISLKYH